MSKFKNLYCEKSAIENIHCFFFFSIQIKLYHDWQFEIQSLSIQK